MNIDYTRFARCLHRCKEVADEPGMNPVVVAVYKEALEEPATAYLTAHDGVSKATTTHEKDSHEAQAALSHIDAPYRVARSALMTICPETVKSLPDTLKSLSTDTDQLTAITLLLNTINDYAGAAWADALLKGDFGVKAGATVTAMGEEIASDKVLSAAKAERSVTYGPAYAKYIGFKRVVRNALGPSSKQYKRIHMRASPGAGDKDEAADKGEAVDDKGTVPVVDTKCDAPAANNNGAVRAGSTKASPLATGSRVSVPVVSDNAVSCTEGGAPVSRAPESQPAS